ncbi:PhiH1 repressor [Haloplanus salilacus]|uniref:PhiH1 repressor n=1 Tax=Haloplanus salilacus TaxID=2949994 RepID=UPI0030CC14A9
MRQPTDDRILEVLREEGNMTPRAVSKEGEVARVDVSRDYAGDRLRELRRYGLIERVDRGLYRLTDNGEAYLDEELDASELEPVDDLK